MPRERRKNKKKTVQGAPRGAVSPSGKLQGCAGSARKGNSFSDERVAGRKPEFWQRHFQGGRRRSDNEGDQNRLRSPRKRTVPKKRTASPTNSIRPHGTYRHRGSSVQREGSM